MSIWCKWPLTFHFTNGILWTGLNKQRPGAVENRQYGVNVGVPHFKSGYPLWVDFVYQQTVPQLEVRYPYIHVILSLFYYCPGYKKKLCSSISEKYNFWAFCNTFPSLFSTWTLHFNGTLIMLSHTDHWGSSIDTIKQNLFCKIPLSVTVPRPRVRVISLVV